MLRWLLLCLFPLLVHAETGRSLSLHEAERLWREHSRELAVQQQAVAGAQADVLTAGQIPNPALSLNLQSISPASGYGAGSLKEKRMDDILRVEQLLERGGKRELRQRGAESRLEAARFDFDDLARQQRALLRRAYFDLMLAQDRQRLAAESAELQARGLAVADKRLRAGDIAPVERSRLAVDKARADNEARQAQSDLEQARQALAYLVGYDDPAQPLLAVDAWPVPGALPGEARLDQRPDLEAARRRMAAAQADRDLARSLRQRDLSIGMQLERNNQGSPTNSFGLGVSMPLFVWHEHEGEIRRAEADLESSRLQYEQTRALAGTQMYQARSALLAAGDRLQRLEQGLLADAERVGAAAELAYNKGAMGLIDLLDARRTLRQVRFEAATARADYAKALSDWQLMAEYGKEK